jgi:hypothetical protein
MGEMSELNKWILETAKDIDAKLCEYAENWKDHTGLESNYQKWDDLFKSQQTRIELIKAITD